jgi:two-component system response regulator WspF
MRIAIVNDLALAREVLRRLIGSVPDYSVAWMAENGEEAVRLAGQDRPDIILMDLVMPVMDGVEATRRIMNQNPCPILLVTSSVSGHFNMVYQAMGHGGLDAVNTPTLGADGKVKDGEGILNRIAKLTRAVAGDFSSQRSAVSGQRSAVSGQRQDLPVLVALGASTGGPEALAQILQALPANLPASVVVIQHIASDFAPSLAKWLQDRCSLGVRVARDKDTPRAGEVLLAGTDDHLVLSSDRHLCYRVEPADYPYRPSVDVFFDSLASFWSRPGVAALLTGMGSDGARGLACLRQAGWYTVAQDEATSVVYGMPRAAVERKAACQVLPLPHIAPAILAQLKSLIGLRPR